MHQWKSHFRHFRAGLGRAPGLGWAGLGFYCKHPSTIWKSIENHLKSRKPIQNHLHSLNVHWKSPEFIGNLLEITWNHSKSLGIHWNHLTAFEMHWKPPNLIGNAMEITCTHLKSLETQRRSSKIIGTPLAITSTDWKSTGIHLQYWKYNPDYHMLSSFAGGVDRQECDIKRNQFHGNLKIMLIFNGGTAKLTDRGVP